MFEIRRLVLVHRVFYSKYSNILFKIFQHLIQNIPTFYSKYSNILFKIFLTFYPKYSNILFQPNIPTFYSKYSYTLFQIFQHFIQNILTFYSKYSNILFKIFQKIVLTFVRRGQPFKTEWTNDGTVDPKIFEDNQLSHAHNHQRDPRAKPT